MPARPFPPAYPHGSLRELFPGIYFVTGSAVMPGPIPMRFSRNMTVVKQGDALTLIGSLRLDDAGLAALDALGKVEHVVRLAGFHGMDDPFYKDRYGAKVWVVKGHVYAAGFDAPKTPRGQGYFEPDVEMDATTELPIEGASLISFECTAGEALLRLDRDGGILVAGDSLQNWGTVDRYFNLPASLVMRLMGFIKPHNVGPGWLRGAKPEIARVKAILDLDFEHVLPVHGEAVLGGAKEKYRPAILGLS
ncbi:MAG: hypothetical protein KC657_18790 [Myxococcales bacterium]|nr:hypothetical protein [Myxococcales bacterium]